MKSSIKWKDKVIRIKDLLNAVFKEYQGSLNLTNKKDTRNFYKILNKILNTKQKGKL